MYTFIYSLILFLVVPLMKIKALRKNYNFSLKERFVLYKDKLDNCLWFHCASIGELNTLKPVYDYYKDRYNILITVSSPRGKRYAIENFKDAKIKELPFDIPFSIKRFLKIYNPKALIIVEGELWYNLIKISSEIIPVVSINSRISPSSFNIYRKFKFLFKNIFDRFCLIIARSEEDAKMISYFTDIKKINVCGDLKFVSSSIKKEINISFHKDKKIIVAGSTYRIEEEYLLDVFDSLKSQATLFLAPRHLERLEEVLDLVKSRGYSYQLFSENKNINSQVVIIDKMGVLSSLYRYADVAFVGGTIENIGGHNILEAIVENIPVVIGKNYYKIKPIYEEFKKYIKVVENKEELKKAIEESLKEDIKINIKEKIDKIFKCYIENLQKVI